MERRDGRPARAAVALSTGGAWKGQREARWAVLVAVLHRAAHLMQFPPALKTAARVTPPPAFLFGKGRCSVHQLRYHRAYTTRGAASGQQVCIAFFCDAPIPIDRLFE